MLSDFENEIYQLVKDYLKKKAFFSIEEIVEYINSKSKLNPDTNRSKIEQILKSFIKKKLIIPGSKLTRENLLNNSVRQEIFYYISSSSGVNVNEIMKFQTIGSNQALWHLKLLEKFQFVRSTKIENQKVFFDYNKDSNHDKVLFYFKNDKFKKIIDYMIHANSALKGTNLAQNLKMNYNTIKKYLDILEELNLVKIITEDDSKSYIFDNENYNKVLNEIKSLK